MKNHLANFLERNRALAILALFFLQFVNAGWDAFSYWDRKELHSVVDSRARIGTLIVCRDWQEFTEDEKRSITANWKAAKYPGEPCRK